MADTKKDFVLLRDHTQQTPQMRFMLRDEVLKLSGIRLIGRGVHGYDEYIRANSEADIRKWLRMYQRRS